MDLLLLNKSLHIWYVFHFIFIFNSFFFSHNFRGYIQYWSTVPSLHTALDWTVFPVLLSHIKTCFTTVLIWFWSIFWLWISCILNIQNNAMVNSYGFTKVSVYIWMMYYDIDFNGFPIQYSTHLLVRFQCVICFFI